MAYMLDQPVIGAREEVVLERGEDFHYEDDQQIAYAAATTLQVPQQVVSHQQSHRHHQTEVTP